jgi:mannitol/fructose-specific phosphotransferase system IIA component (Ntr-type)
MKFCEIITQKRIVPELQATSKNEAIRELLEAFDLSSKDFKKTYDLIIEREAKGTTGMGEGIAIPHTHQVETNKIVCAFGRSQDGVEFAALDGRLVHLVFMVLSSESQREQHVECLKYISKKMKNTLYKNFLLDAKGKREIFKTLKELDEKE